MSTKIEHRHIVSILIRGRGLFRLKRNQIGEQEGG